MATQSDKRTARPLHTPVQFLKGVGPDRAELLRRMGLLTALDLLFFFPRDYQEIAAIQTVDQLQEDVPLSVCGTVLEIDQHASANGRTITGVLLQQDRGCLRGIWFNQPFMRDRFVVGQRVVFSGTARNRGLRWEMVHPRVTMLASGQEHPGGEILPVYRLTEGITQAQMRRIVQHVAQEFAATVPEVFPEDFLQQQGLFPIERALRQIHQPDDAGQLDQARFRLVYQELIVMQLALNLKRQQLLQRGRAPVLPVDTRIDARIRRLFPFELTPAQRQAIEEIATDMSRPVPMNRLLQGDVGTGKTVVAAYAMLLTVAHGWQAVMMAPTEVLARQHFDTLTQLLARSHVRIGLLTGGTPARERGELVAQLQQGECDLLVGTHAVLQDDVRFAQLGLVVIDEQHKFGVRQRAGLRESDVDPHYLIMSATPIPRTVAMTVFGDLDVSLLRDSPPGRQPVHTYRASDDQRGRWWAFFRRKLGEGRQGFVVAPLVEGNEQGDLASAEGLRDQLARGELAGFRLDLVHGRMSPEAKQAAIDRFRQGVTQVLVATSVIEVGIDIPNANLMTIEHGERFGLAQLHQLRGRVCRGHFPGYVCVFAGSDSPEAEQRLAAFVNTTDGFELAEIDFQLRGPGELFGTRQHGLPPLRMADLQRDQQVVQQARQDAERLLRENPELQDPRFERLRRMVVRRYGKAMDLADVG